MVADTSRIDMTEIEKRFKAEEKKFNAIKEEIKIGIKKSRILHTVTYILILVLFIIYSLIMYYYSLELITEENYLEARKKFKSISFSWGLSCFIVNIIAIYLLLRYRSANLIYECIVQYLLLIILFSLIYMNIELLYQFDVMRNFPSESTRPFRGDGLFREEISNMFGVEDFLLIFADYLYFSIVTITTLGFGDIVPAHWFPKLLVCMETLLGIFMIVLALGIHMGGNTEHPIYERLDKRSEYILTRASQERIHHNIEAILKALKSEKADRRDDE